MPMNYAICMNRTDDISIIRYLAGDVNRSCKYACGCTGTDTCDCGDGGATGAGAPEAVPSVAAVVV